MEDSEAWTLFPKHHWIYNKLELCQRLGYPCAPHGIDPMHFPVFSKPIYNLWGLGIGAEVWNSWDDIRYQPGHFWMPYFEGTHVSVDCIGDKSHISIKREDHWEVNKSNVDWDDMPIDPFKLAADHHEFNLEAIGGKIIEIHLRRSYEFSPLYRTGGFMIPIFTVCPVPNSKVSNIVEIELAKRNGMVLDDEYTRHARGEYGYRTGYILTEDLEAGRKLRDKVLGVVRA